MSNLVEPVVAQLDAYNRKDIDAFIAAYAEDVKGWDIGGTLLWHGHAAMRARYIPYWARNPRLRAEVISRMVGHCTVIDQEYVTGYADGTTLHAFAIYEVLDGLITQAWFRREPS